MHTILIKRRLDLIIVILTLCLRSHPRGRAVESSTNKLITKIEASLYLLCYSLYEDNIKISALLVLKDGKYKDLTSLDVYLKSVMKIAFELKRIK